MWSADIMKCTHSMGHRSAVLGQGRPFLSCSSCINVQVTGAEHCFHELFKRLCALWGPLTKKKWEQQLRNAWTIKYVCCAKSMLTGLGAVTNTGFASTPRCSSLPAMRCDSSPALHWTKTLAVHVWNNFQFKYIERLLCKRSVCILAVWAGLWLKPSYTTPFWMHVRGSQLTSLLSSQTFIDPTTFPLFQKLDEKVSRSLLENEGGRIWKLFWMTSSVQT